MNKKIELLGVILLAIVFAIGMFTVIPKVNAEDNFPGENGLMINNQNVLNSNGTNQPIISISDDEIICPAVCVPVWVVENKTCRFIECASGCLKADGINYFETENDCRLNYNKRAQNPNVPIERPPLMEDRVGLQARFTPMLENNNEGYIYNFSKIHLRIVSTKVINVSEYNLTARMTEADPSSTEVKEVYLNIRNLNNASEENNSDVELYSIMDVSNNRAEVYTQVTNNNASVSISNQVVASNNVKTSDDKAFVEANQNSSKLRKVYVYNYLVNFVENQAEIEAVFGNDYKNKAYKIDVVLTKVLSAEEINNKEIVDSKNFYVKYGSSKNLPNGLAKQITIVQEEVRVSQGQISSEVSQAVNKVKGRIADVKSLDGYEVYTDEDMTEMYISNQEKVRKIKPINQVLVSNKIKAENVVGNVELVLVDNNPEYVLKIREKRKILGFIPFGHREKYVSLNASEEIDLSQEIEITE